MIIYPVNKIVFWVESIDIYIIGCMGDKVQVILKQNNVVNYIINIWGYSYIIYDPILNMACDLVDNLVSYTFNYNLIYYCPAGRVSQMLVDISDRPNGVDMDNQVIHNLHNHNRNYNHSHNPNLNIVYHYYSY